MEKRAICRQTAGSIKKRYAHSYTFPDKGYANVHLTGVQYAIARDSIQGHLCRSCLDCIDELWFDEDPPAENGVLSLAERTSQPLITCTTGFEMGNFHVDCDFEDGGKIDLLIFYCPPRYK